jgi:hypothetical protein
MKKKTIKNHSNECNKTQPIPERIMDGWVQVGWCKILPHTVRIHARFKLHNNCKLARAANNRYWLWCNYKCVTRNECLYQRLQFDLQQFDKSGKNLRYFSIRIRSKSQRTCALASSVTMWARHDRAADTRTNIK